MGLAKVAEVEAIEVAAGEAVRDGEDDDGFVVGEGSASRKGGGRGLSLANTHSREEIL